MIYSSFILYVVKIFFLFQQLVFSVLPIIKIQTIYLSIDRSIEIPSARDTDINLYVLSFSAWYPGADESIFLKK